MLYNAIIIIYVLTLYVSLDLKIDSTECLGQKGSLLKAKCTYHTNDALYVSVGR